MSLLSRLLKPRPDRREHMRPLWHRIVEIAREPAWYAKCGAADTVAGRFDLITAVLSMVLIRMEGEPELVEPSVRLTELFVDDMDGQLRESGVGDVVVGKHIGRLMSVLGGRLGAYRSALADENGGAMQDAVSRNVSFADGGDPASLAAELEALCEQLRGTPAEALLAGVIAR